MRCRVLAAPDRFEARAIRPVSTDSGDCRAGRGRVIRVRAPGCGVEDRGVHIEFARREGGGSLATIDRPDGVRLLLTSYDRANSVPHDLAHFVTERDLGLRRGLWGSIADGALFDSVQFIAGKRRHDDAARSRAVRRANADELALVEVLVGAMCRGLPMADAAAAREIGRAWSSVRDSPCPFPPDRRTAAVNELRRLGLLFGQLDASATLALDWPTAPAARTGGRRRRR
ncbi:hypothetical protein GCM10023403_01380 [Pseudonocardia benzenivorans]|nr:hypothetical protein PSD17_44770 [Pseudonocardia sp. D17]